MPTPRDQPEILEDILVVGEGAGDAALVRHLCSNRNITGLQIEDAGGASKFETFMRGLSVRKGIHKLRGLVIIADCDDSPDNSFNTIRKQMRAADIPYPDNPFTVARRPNLGNFASYVVMLPFENNQSRAGSLETLLLPSALANLAQHVPCLDDWSKCAALQQLSTTHRDKVRLRALLSAAHPDDPNIGLQYALSPSKNLIPLGYTCFDPLVDVLRTLPSLI